MMRLFTKCQPRPGLMCTNNRMSTVHGLRGKLYSYVSVINTRPTKNMTVRGETTPWVTYDYISFAQERDYFKRKAESSGDPELWSKYRTVRNFVNNLREPLRKEHYANVIFENQNSPGKLWKVMKQMMGTSKSCKTSITCLASGKKKGKGSFYIAQYPVRWTAQSALHFLPSLTDLFIPTPFSASPGSILAMQKLRATTKSLTFPPLSIAMY